MTPTIIAVFSLVDCGRLAQLANLPADSSPSNINSYDSGALVSAAPGAAASAQIDPLAIDAEARAMLAGMSDQDLLKIVGEHLKRAKSGATVSTNQDTRLSSIVAGVASPHLKRPGDEE